MTLSPRLWLGALALAGLFFSSAAHADATFTITGDPADQGLMGNASSFSGTDSNNFITVGSGGGTTPQRVGVFIFKLPTLAAGARFGTANLTVTLDAKSGPGGNPTFSANLSGITRTSASPAVQAGAAPNNDAQDAATLLQTGFVAPTTTAGTARTSDDISSFLNTQYAAAPGQYIYFRLDGPANTSINDNFVFYSANTQNAITIRPTLTGTIQDTSGAPEASGIPLLLIPLGLLMGAFLRRRLSGSPRTGG